MAIGTMVYYVSKKIVGFEVDLATAFKETVDSLYWSGAALFVHWVVHRATKENCLHERP